MTEIAKWVDTQLDAIQAILLSILVKLGPFAVALMPALFSGYAVYVTFQEKAGAELALLFAVIVALAIETVGIVLAHTAIEMYNGYTAGVVDIIKLGLVIILIPFYIIGVAGVVIYADKAFDDLIQALGVASPFLTCAVYVAVALARDYHRVEQELSNAQNREIERSQDEIDWQREKERIELANKHSEKLARINAKSTRNATPQTQPKKQPVASTENISPKERNEMAREILCKNPNISGAELGRNLGLSPRMGQMIKKGLDTQEVNLNGH